MYFRPIYTLALICTLIISAVALGMVFNNAIQNVQNIDPNTPMPSFSDMVDGGTVIMGIYMILGTSISSLFVYIIAMFLLAISDAEMTMIFSALAGIILTILNLVMFAGSMIILIYTNRVHSNNDAIFSISPPTIITLYIAGVIGFLVSFGFLATMLYGIMGGKLKSL